ncbi:ATP-binding cassette domain-containing protein [Anaerosporobacter faecicola]|uniref:ATP-binding cassette domain-containing protein n=1 Tax=Anaerosporobacter faecicola TaxID=2718714 RepID=UPI00143BC92E|nr:ABC transporter ATP-binding protein [Anaerosporobacter faecicola]
MDYILEVENVCKKLDGFSLENINFKLEPGYIMGLIGQNGSGKTTLINTILGLYQRTMGNVKICGHDLNLQESKAKGEIGFVLDENPFIEEISSLDNAKIYAPYYREFDMRVFLKYCSRFDVDPKKKLKKLSKGTIVKFQLAFALSHKAKLFIMDEPASGLDPVFRKELTEIMYDEILNGDKSIVFSSHLTEEIDMVADYVTLIHQGKQIISTSKEELFDNYRIVKGSEEKIRNLKEYIIGEKVTQYTVEALVKNEESILNQGCQIEIPTISDFMYYFTNAKKEVLTYV